MDTEKLPSLIALYSPAQQSGKTTVAKYMVEKYDYIRLSFASPLKAMMTTLLEASGYSDSEADEYVYGSRKEDVIPIFGRTSREMMQTLGTEWGRNAVSPDIWMKVTERKMVELLDAGKRVIIDDMRFHNEFEMVCRHGGHTIKVFRRTVDQIPVHSSEGALTHQQFDSILTNGGTIENLLEKVAGLFA